MTDARACVTKLRPGHRRFEWLRAVCGPKKYPDIVKRVAVVLSWDFSDRTTGITFVGVDRLAYELCISKRQIMRALKRLREDGFLKQVSKPSRDHPVKYLLTCADKKDAAGTEDDEAF